MKKKQDFPFSFVKIVKIEGLEIKVKRSKGI
jgi:hypothetical protein